ncbi:MAG: hypothetical protein ACK4M6_13180 [Hyphomonas sp.]
MAIPIEPTPKQNVRSMVERAAWATTSVLPDVRVAFSTERPFEQILQERRTRRVFDPVPLREVRGFVQHLFALQYEGHGRQAGRARKAFLSAGALHPIDVIILAGPEVDEPILFDDRRSKFGTLPILDVIGFNEAVSAANAVQSTARGHLLLFAGDSRLVAANYHESQSLLWRDAGAALQACAIGAQAYGYAFCPLGTTGREALRALGPPHREYIALALAVLGR